MFRNLLSRLFAEEHDLDPLNSEDAEVAIAALLVRVARADDRYRQAERDRIDQILSRRRGLSAQAASERRSAAEMIEAEAPDTVRFTRHIKGRIALEDRTAIIGAMWEIAYADKDRGADEEAVIRLVSGLLGVNDRDAALSRQDAMDQLGIARNRA